MASNPESHADIVKEMREFGDHCAAFGGAYSPERWDKLCNRLEAAHNREIDELKSALDKIYKCVDNRYGVDVSLLVKSIIADALEVGK